MIRSTHLREPLSHWGPDWKFSYFNATLPARALAICNKKLRYREEHSASVVLGLLYDISPENVC